MDASRDLRLDGMDDDLKSVEEERGSTLALHRRVVFPGSRKILAKDEAGNLAKTVLYLTLWADTQHKQRNSKPNGERQIEQRMRGITEHQRHPSIEEEPNRNWPK